MYSTKPNKRPSKPTTYNEEEEGSDEFCGLSIGFSSNDPSTDMSTIFMGFRYYWEKPTTGSDAFSLGPISTYDTSSFKAHAGAYAHFFTAYDLTMEGTKLRFEADLELSAMAGLGFSINTNGKHDDVELEIKKIPIIGIPEINLLGIKFGFGIYVFSNIVYKNIKSQLIELMKYDYRVKMGLKTHLTYTTSDGPGFTTVTPIFEIMDDKQTPEKVINDKLKDMYFDITPSVEIGVEASAMLGVSTLNSEGFIAFKAFLGYEVPFSFTFDEESCTFPYLYGEFSHKATLNFEVEGLLKLFGITLIDSSITRPITIFQREPNGKFCFFDSLKSIDAKFSDKNGNEAYVVNPMRIKYCPKCTSVVSDPNPVYHITLNYYQYGPGAVTEKFNFPAIPLVSNNRKWKWYLLKIINFFEITSSR